MCKVYLYSRVSTSDQSLAQQERTVYEWLNHHNMKVDEVVTDEGVSGGVSYADRNLGKVLLPMMVEGDAIIVSEVSRLGRSMYDLSKLVNTELKTRKLRLIIVSMGLDLNCAKMTAIDELILSNFSFAAQLEKQLISERTLSALQVKKKQGVKLGGAADKWAESYKNKTKEEIKEIGKKRGFTKCDRYLSSRDVQAFLRVLKNVFPDACVEEDIEDWDWSSIGTKGDSKQRMAALIKDYRDFDDNGVLFKKWDIENWDDLKIQVRLSTQIKNIKRSIKLKNKNQ